MPGKQTRRSISVKGTTYATLRKYCDQQGRSMSDIVEEQLANLFAMDALPAVSVKKAQPVLANKMVRAEPASTGRPAPRPAADVVEERVRAPKNDYRNIRF